jgi:hypothetical protein
VICVDLDEHRGYDRTRHLEVRLVRRHPSLCFFTFYMWRGDAVRLCDFYTCRAEDALWQYAWRKALRQLD